MVTLLKFGFQFHFELAEIDEIPAREFPCALFPSGLVFEPNDQVHSVIAHFIRSHFWFEIECAEAPVTTPGKIKLWIEIEHPLARYIDNAQIGIAGTTAKHSPIQILLYGMNKTKTKRILGQGL